MSMEGLRQGAQNVRGSGGKGPQRLSYYARWKPPAMKEDFKRFLAAAPSEESYLQVSEPIVLIPGQYQDLLARTAEGAPIVPPPVIEAYRFRSHTFPVFIQPKNAGQPGFKSFRDIVCSAGTEAHAPQPCLGCYQVDHGAKDSKPRDQWAFNIAHLSWYHQHPLLKDGQIQYKKGTQDPVMVKDQCYTHRMENLILSRAAQAQAKGVRAPKPCEGCNGQQPFHFGDHRVLQVGFKHLKNILSLDEELGKKCANCGTFIIRVAFDCVKCGKEILNVGQSGWTNDQLDTYSKSPQSCPHCHQVDLPKSVYECGFDERYARVSGGCPDNVEPRKTSVFDCVLWTQREGENTESEIVVKKVELISSFKTPEGRPLNEHLKELVKAPYNLTEMYSPDTLDEQAETIRVQNPYAAPQQQQQYAPYGQQPGQYPAPQVAPPGYGPPQGMPAPGGYVPPGQQPAPYPNMPMPGRPNFGK
jgi:DNA-directed RNA polymerase subunit RPC12/RpoP